MTKKELKESLDREGIDPEWYYLDGGMQSERLTLAKDGHTWTVYYSQRGLRTGRRLFNSEGGACDYFLKCICEEKRNV